MTKAAAGQILATSEVLARSRTEFHAEPLEPFSVKGKSEPVQAFLVGSAAGLRFRRGDTPLVGRDEELRTLLEGVESARRYDGRIVEVVGDPGIGKSRLIEELGENVTPDVFIQVQCDEYEATTPYHPFQGLLRSLLSTNSSGDDITPARLRRRVERGAPQLLPWLPLLAVPARTRAAGHARNRASPGRVPQAPAPRGGRRPAGHAASPAHGDRLRRRPLARRGVRGAAEPPFAHARGAAVARRRDPTRPADDLLRAGRGQPGSGLGSSR